MKSTQNAMEKALNVLVKVREEVTPVNKPHENVFLRLELHEAIALLREALEENNEQEADGRA